MSRIIRLTEFDLTRNINGMLDNINKLAFNQGNKQPKIGDLPKPNLS